MHSRVSTARKGIEQVSNCYNKKQYSETSSGLLRDFPQACAQASSQKLLGLLKDCGVVVPNLG